MALIAPDPVIPSGFAPVPALPPGPVRFERETWDNPIRFPLNRSYGDEFEYRNLTEFKRQWRVRNLADSAFSFPGGSTVEITFPGATSGLAIYRPAPAGDFETVWELSLGSPSGLAASYGSMISALILDSSGGGAGASEYWNAEGFDGWNISGWAYSSTGVQGLGTVSRDGGHRWYSLRRVSGTYYSRLSVDGSTWILAASWTPPAFTPSFIGLGAMYTGGNNVVVRLHRLNTYTGPTFFTG